MLSEVMNQMMKKISLTKLKDRFNGRSAKRSAKRRDDRHMSDTKDDDEADDDDPPLSADDRIHTDVHYDRLSTQSDSNLAINSNDTNKLKKFPAVLLQSFRKKFRRNKSKQKVNDISQSQLKTSTHGLAFGCQPTQVDPKSHSHDIELSAETSEVVSGASGGQHEDNTLIDTNVYKTDLQSDEMHLSSLLSNESLIDVNINESVEPIQRKSSIYKKSSLVKEIERIVRNGWYWGPISRREAEDKLRDQTDGSFLVRDSCDDHYLFSLSFRSFGRTLHTRIEYTNGLFSFYSNGSTDGNSSLMTLIEESMSDSQNRVFCYSRGRSSVSPSFPVRLTRPVSRFSEVSSLQYLCRFVIRQSITFSQIQSLPIPKSIRGFIENAIL